MGFGNSRKKKQTPSSSLDAKRLALEEEQRRIEKEIAQRKDLIERAPEIAREQERKQRDQFVAKASHVGAGNKNHASLPDRRHVGYNVETATARPGRRLKRERRRGMATFFMLLLTLLAIIAWIYHTLPHGL